MGKEARVSQPSPGERTSRRPLDNSLPLRASLSAHISQLAPLSEQNSPNQLWGRSSWSPTRGAPVTRGKRASMKTRDKAI